ncbi:MAG: carbamoyltransferase, partial [Chloroflexi bacterium]
MYTLGINAAYHDPAACLVHDGVVVAAVEEERFTRIKHGKRPTPFSSYELPFHAIEYCLGAAGISLMAVDHVAYSYDPYLLLGTPAGAEDITLPLEPSAHPIPEEWEAAWDPLFLAGIVNAARHLSSGAPHPLRERFRGASPDGPYRWHWVPHHMAHAASAFLPSPFPRAAILTVDGRGEQVTTSYALGDGADISMLDEVRMPHSLGLLYERVTDHLGFLQSSDEYKVMALASFGRPRYADVFREIVRRGHGGQYTIDSRPLEEDFGPARRRGGPLETRHYDIARSLQEVLEETVLALAGWLHEATGERGLCLAGGVALNCVLNARLRDVGPFEHIWVQPAAGDAGTALGAALWIDTRQRPDAGRRYQMDHAYLGPAYDDAEIETLLRWSGVAYHRMTDIPGEVADLLAAGQIVGWFQGQAEWGPRALGARSILASPIDAGMQARLNDIKDREDFRPVAPVVIEEEAAHWFAGATQSPFMLFVYDILPECVERIPAVRHVDGTARIQTINRDQQPQYYDLLRAFAARTAVPILINTSFNTRGEPMVLSPRDALESFWTTPLDALAIGPF